MSESRYVLAAVVAFISALAAAGVPAAEVTGGLEATRGLVQAGAAHLALRRIDRLQPSDFAAPRWVEWERLRLQVLARINRHDELLKRAGALPSTLAPEARADLQAIAAQAALAQGRVAIARDYASRTLWTEGVSATQLRELRLLVIRSYARESHAADAYRSMLRFQQDYRPLDAVTAAEFVHALLDLDRVDEAVDWLGVLDEKDAAKLRLRLRAGLVTPQDAVGRARTALTRGADDSWWRVILDAAQRQSSAALRLEALEQLLDAVAPHRVSPAQLWDAYGAFARNSANTYHLLAGDDAGWFEFAQRRRDADPVVARAFFAHLARSARAPSVRRGAQAQLAVGYATARLPRAGLRLFTVAAAALGPLDDAARYALGGFATAVKEPARALEYWHGLPAPAGTTAESWDLRLAALALRANRSSVANDIARRLGAEKSVLGVPQVQAWFALAQQFTDHGQHDGARLLLERALLYADSPTARTVLAALGRAHEESDNPLLAADFYLRSALRATAPDAAAAAARLRAGLALAHAGLRDDARAQFEWLLQNAKDPAQTAIARRELGR